MSARENHRAREDGPLLGDCRVKVQRTGRFKWNAVGERYVKRFERPDGWEAIRGYRNGWRHGPVRWLPVALARLDVWRDARRRRREEKRRTFEETSYVDINS